MIKSLKQAEYYLFVEWTSTPQAFREPKTQGQFSDLHNVSHDTLARWKKDPLFWEDVRRAVKEWSRELTPQVIQSLFLRTQDPKGHPLFHKLWLEHVEEHTEHTDEQSKGGTGESLAELLRREYEESVALANSSGDSETEIKSNDKSTEQINAGSGN